MVWRFGRHGNLSDEDKEKIEQKAVRLVAYTFLILAAYVLFESVKKLYLREIPETSITGIIVAVLSLIIMPILFYKKYKIGKSLKSMSLIADSKETLACCSLSVALLIGLGLNYLFGLWQADPIVGILIVIFLAREGYEMLTGEED